MAFNGHDNANFWDEFSEFSELEFQEWFETLPIHEGTPTTTPIGGNIAPTSNGRGNNTNSWDELSEFSELQFQEWFESLPIHEGTPTTTPISGNNSPTSNGRGNNTNIWDELSEFSESQFQEWFESLPIHEGTPTTTPIGRGNNNNFWDEFSGFSESEFQELLETIAIDENPLTISPNGGQLFSLLQQSSSSSFPPFIGSSTVASMASSSSLSETPVMANIIQIQHSSPSRYYSNMEQMLSPSFVPSPPPPPPPPPSKLAYLKAHLDCSRLDGSLPEHAMSTLVELGESVSQTGNPTERFVFYFTRALYSWISNTPNQFGVQTSLEQRLNLYDILVEKCPFLDFANLVSNDSIMRFVNGGQIHIIDFGMFRASQWEMLLHMFANLTHKPSKIRISCVITSILGTAREALIILTGNQLYGAANSLNLNLEFTMIADPILSLSASSFQTHTTEMIIVNFTFQLYNFLSESEDEIKKLLRVVKSINPYIVTVAEYELNVNKVPFLHRINNAFCFYSAIFESLAAGFEEEDMGRVMVESVLIAPRIAEVIEFDERSDNGRRFEDKKGWWRLMTECGLNLFPNSGVTVFGASSVVPIYDSNYLVKETAPGFISLAWKDVELVTTSLWY